MLRLPCAAIQSCTGTGTFSMIRGALVESLEKCSLKDPAPGKLLRKQEHVDWALGRQCLHPLPKYELLKSDEVISFDSLSTMKILGSKEILKLKSD